MKTLHYVDVSQFHTTLENTIKLHFKNWSVDEFKFLCKSDSEHLSFLKYFDPDNLDFLIHFKNGNYRIIGSIIVIEYLLTEEQMLELLVGNGITCEIVSVQYFFFDKEKNKFKKILTSFAN